MNIAAFSIERNRVVLSLLAVVIVMGLVGYSKLSRDSMPPYTVRVASVVTSFPGASPERVESLVTDKVEKIVQELPELKKIGSSSRTGLSVVSVELKMEVEPQDLQAVWDRLRRKLSGMKGLPSAVVPDLKDDGVGEVFGIAVALSSDGYSYAEMKEVADDIRDDLIRLKDGAKVEFAGIQDERVFVEFEDSRLKAFGLTAATLQALITNTNILNSGGQVQVQDERFILEPTGSFTDIENIRSMLVPVGGGARVVPLEDIAKVHMGYVSPAKQLVRVNGREAISLHLSLKKGANIIQLGQDVDEVVDRWNSRLPIGLELQRISSIDSYIEVKIKDFVSNLIQAIVVVLVVMLIFLGIRTGLVIASLIPMVTVTTLMVMGLIGMGLNQITLAALIIALGMMVDNAIVVAESIMVKMEKGTSAKDAAIESCAELITPLLISTLTTSAAFLAFYMAESTMGDIMGPLFVVISIALLSSWLIALSMVTLFCVFFLKVSPPAESQQGLVDRLILKMKLLYQSLILVALNWKKSVILGIVLMFALSLYGFGLLGFVFFPESDRNLVTVDIKLPEGTRIETTTQTVTQIEAHMRQHLMVGSERSEGIVDWAAFIGKGPSSYDLGYQADEANSNYAHILVNTSTDQANPMVVANLDAYGFNHFPNADIKVGLLSSGGGGTPIEVRLSADDTDQLSTVAESVKAKLGSIAGTKNIKDDWGPKGKKFVVRINPSLAQAAGLSNQDVATSLKTVLDGFEAGEFRQGDKNIPIVMVGNRATQPSLDALESLNVYAQRTGKSVPLSQIARIEPDWQYSKIKRLDQVRTVVVSCQLKDGGNASAILSELRPWLEEKSQKWGDAIEVQFGGDAENTADNMGAVLAYLPLSGFIIVILLIVQFNSMRKTLMVVSTIPLGVIGMVIGLLIFGVPFGFMAFLGVISLAGIVINNGIVLIDCIESEQSVPKRSSQDAVVGACLQRFRPILLATFTTVLGLIPLYLGGGAIWEPMAVTIMVGLMFGTVITLFFIPCLFALLYRVDFQAYRFNEALMKA